MAEANSNQLKLSFKLIKIVVKLLNFILYHYIFVLRASLGLYSITPTEWLVFAGQDSKLGPAHQQSSCSKRKEKKIISTFCGFRWPCFQSHVHFFPVHFLPDAANGWPPESVCNKLTDINIPPFKLASPFISFGSRVFSLVFSFPIIFHLGWTAASTFARKTWIVMNRTKAYTQRFCTVSVLESILLFKSSNAFKHIKLAVEQ